MELNLADWIAWVLLIVGGINLGLVGFFSFDLVESVFMSMPVVARVIFGVVGIAAVYSIATVGKLIE